VDALNCDELSVREVNEMLRHHCTGTPARIQNPRGRHNLAVGLSRSVEVTIEGNAGYFLGGLGGTRGGAGPDIRGSASESAGASAHGGVIVIEGDASLRAGISLKGGTVAIAGNAGAMSGFMAQAGTILIGGDAGHGLGDSLYEAVIYVGGSISSLGADACEQELSDDDVLDVKRLVALTGFDHIDPNQVRRVGSARRLYHFSPHHHGSY